MPSKRNEQGQTLEEFLKSYDPTIYKNPAVCVDMAVFSVSESTLKPTVLLIKRRNHPFIGEYALPGGFVEIDEEVEAAAKRELFEEASIQLDKMYEYGSFGRLGRDPRTRIISIAHLGIVPMGAFSPKAGDDASDARVFTLNFTRDNNICLITLCDGENTLKLSLETENDDYFNLPIKIKRVYESSLASDHSEILLKGLQHLCLMNRDTLIKQLKPLVNMQERLREALNILAEQVLGS